MGIYKCCRCGRTQIVLDDETNCTFPCLCGYDPDREAAERERIEDEQDEDMLEDEKVETRRAWPAWRAGV